VADVDEVIARLSEPELVRRAIEQQQQLALAYL